MLDQSGFNNKFQILIPSGVMYMKKWITFCRNQKVKTDKDLLSSSIWYSGQISPDNLFYETWFKKGIRIVADLLNSDGAIFATDELKTMYKFNLNILHYFRIKHLITKFIDSKNGFSKVKLERPHVPFHINVVLNPEKRSKQLYTILSCDGFEQPNNEKKWSLELNTQLNSEFWTTSYKICFKAVLDNSYVWFQYRNLHRILGTKDHLHKLNLSESFTCGICGQ